MVMMDSYRRLILPGFFRIGVNSRRHFDRRPVVTLRVSYRPFEDLMAGFRVSLNRTLSAPFESLRAVSLSNRSNWFMAQTALKPHLILDDDISLD